MKEIIWDRHVTDMEQFFNDQKTNDMFKLLCNSLVIVIVQAVILNGM